MPFAAGKTWREGIIIGRHKRNKLSRAETVFNGVCEALAKHHRKTVQPESFTLRHIGPHSFSTLFGPYVSGKMGCLLRIDRGAGRIVLGRPEDDEYVPASQNTTVRAHPQVLRAGDWVYIPPTMSFHIESCMIGRHLYFYLAALKG